MLWLLLACTPSPVAEPDVATVPERLPPAPEPASCDLKVQARDGRWGCIDRDGRWAVQPHYLGFTKPDPVGVAYRELGKPVLLDLTRPHKLRVIDLAPLTGVTELGSNRFTFREPGNPLYGLLNDAGAVVVKPTFTSVGTFRHGRAPVCTGPGACGYIDAQGSKVLSAQFTATLPFPLSEDALARVQRTEQRWGFASVDGVVRGDYAEVREFREGRSWVRTEPGGRWLLVDTQLSVVATLDAAEVRPFYEGAAIFRRDQRWGMVDPDGTELIPPRFTQLRRLSQGLAAARDDGGRWGYVDRNGLWKIPHDFEGYGALPARGEPEDLFREMDFSEDRAVVVFHGKRGYIDLTGTMRVSPKYDRALPFEDGVAWVEKDGFGRWIDPRGLEVSPATPR